MGVFKIAIATLGATSMFFHFKMTSYLKKQGVKPEIVSNTGDYFTSVGLICVVLSIILFFLPN